VLTEGDPLVAGGHFLEDHEHYFANVVGENDVLVPVRKRFDGPEAPFIIAVREGADLISEGKSAQARTARGAAGSLHGFLRDAFHRIVLEIEIGVWCHLAVTGRSRIGKGSGQPGIGVGLEAYFKAPS